MSNTITIEFSKEDRDRLDGIGVLIGNLIDCLKSNTTPKGTDEIQQRLAEVLTNAKPAEAPKNAAGATEDETPATTQPNEEEPTVKEPAPTVEAVAPSVTLEQIQQKVVQLAAGFGGAKKAAVRAVINAYGTKVSDLKDQPEKWDEVYEKLTALESEG